MAHLGVGTSRALSPTVAGPRVVEPPCGWMLSMIAAALSFGPPPEASCDVETRRMANGLRKALFTLSWQSQAGSRSAAP